MVGPVAEEGEMAVVEGDEQRSRMDEAHPSEATVWSAV